MILSLVAGPTAELITLAEAKAHLRLETNLDDAYVNALIVAARQYVEKISWRAFVTQTWMLTLDGFPGDVIELPRGSLISVATVQYLDPNNVSQVVPNTVYELDKLSIPGHILLKEGQSWPDTLLRWNAVNITYDVGYGPTPADVPEPVKHVVKLLVSQMYEHRTPEVTGTIVSQVKFAVDALLYNYRLMRFA